jgi:hypothetical protein
MVPFDEVYKYEQKINKATLRESTNYGHFNTSKFPEILETITKESITNV